MWGRSAHPIGPNELSIRDPSLIHPILGQGGLPKGPRTYVASLLFPICNIQQTGWEGRPGRPNLISQRDPILHMQERKPWSRAFSSTAMREYEIVVAKRVRQLVGCLEDVIERSNEKASAVVDMAQWLKYFR